MFERLGSLTYRFRFPIVAAWIAAAVGAVLLAPSLASEGMTNPASFLPRGSASVEARDALERAFPGATATSSATLSFTRDTGLTDADRAFVGAVARWADSGDAPEIVRTAVTGVATADTRPELAAMLRSADGRLELVTLDLDVVSAGSAADAVVSAIRDHLAATAPAGLDAHVTGTAAISSDYLAAIVKGTDSTTAVTVALVVVILLLIYRAPLAALVPLVTIAMAFLVSRGVLGMLAAAGWRISSLLDTFVVVLVFGVGTDYAIFLISRYREEVVEGNWHDASRTTVRRIGAVISASAATVIVGLGSMAFAEFGMIQTMGPALAVAIFVTLVAGLTLAPALLAIFGHYLFWPRHARTRPDGEPGGVFATLAGMVSRRPGIVTVGLLVALLLPATFIGRMQTNFDVLSELPATSDARAGFDQIADHLGKGKVVQAAGILDAGAGADSLAPASLARLRDVSRALLATDGVASVTTLVSPDGDGAVPDGFVPSAQLTTMADGFAGDPGSGTSTDASALLGDAATDGIDAATEYLGLLATAFPDAAAGTGYRAALGDLTTARSQVQTVRDNAVVATQLRSLVRSMTASAAAAAGGDDSIAIVRDYLDELGTAFPAIRSLEAWTSARDAAARLARAASIDAGADLASGLSTLETWFVDHDPKATLVSESLARTTEAKRQKAAIEATFDALPIDLRALAATFAVRPDDLFVPLGMSGTAGDDLRDAVAAFVSDGRSASRLWLTTTDDPYSQAAFDAVRHAQDTLAAAETGFGPAAAAYLGGPTAEFADVQTVLGHDFQRVAVVTVLGILVVLVLLLRAVVAPLYLVATVLLSCATTLGLSAWFFQSVLGDGGVSFYLPLIVFVLLVALGSDYNIFLMSRVREESEHRPIRTGVRVASGRTGAVITSAGLILAGTFGSMASAPLTVLVQVGLAVGVGVLVDTFVVRSILVPAITTLAGDRAWWPSGSRAALVARHAWRVLGRPGRLAGRVELGVAAAEGGGGAGPGRTTWTAAALRRRTVALVLVAVVPMLVAGLFVSSRSEATAHLGGLTAAVVNDDLGATMPVAGGTGRPVTLGADLVARLASATDSAADSATFAWVTADAATAQAGFADGRFVAILTIPADFSATIAAIHAGGAAGASRATLHLATGDATGDVLGPIARSLVASIVSSTADPVTAGYVDDVLLSVDTTHDRVAAAADRAGEVDANAAAVATGASGVSATADQLVAGLAEIAAGATSAGAGADRLATGVSALATGSRRIATGVADIGGGARLAAAGADGVAAGTSKLADGLAAIAAGTADLPDQTQALADGATRVASGAAGLAAGTTAMAGSLDELRTATAGLGDRAAALDTVAAKVAAGSGSLRAGVGELADAAGSVATNAGALRAAVGEYTDAAAGLAADCGALGGSDAVCARLDALAAGNDALNANAAAMVGGSRQVAGAGADLAGTAASLAGVATQLRAGTAELAATAPALEGGIGRAAAGGPILAAGAADLAAGADRLASGTAILAGSAPELASGITKSAAGARSLAAGGRSVADGLATLATGADRVAAAAKTAADGAASLAVATSAAAGGAAALGDALTGAAAAAQLVQSGAAGVADDGRAVASDAATLATGLGRDAATIPSWTDAARDQVSRVVADPVAVAAEPAHLTAGAGAAVAPYFLGLGLWIGALALFLVVPAVRGRDARSRWWIAPAEAYLVAAAVGLGQAALAIVTLRLIGIEIARPLDALAFTLLAAVTFIAISQAFVALLGNRGWLLAAMFAVLQAASAGAPYPIETAPGFFQALHPLLPLTHAVEAVRTSIAGGGPSVVPAAVALGLWLAGSLLVTLAVTRHRAAPPRSAVVAAAGA